MTSWGNNSFDLPGLSNVVAVAGGYSYSVALKSDGTMTAWGSNSLMTASPPADVLGRNAADLPELPRVGTATWHRVHQREMVCVSGFIPRLI